MTSTVTERAGSAGAAPGSGSRRLTERVFRIRESGIIAVFLVFVGVTTAIQPQFLNQQNIQFLLVNTVVYALLALGETMVVISRNVDLSIGSVLGLSAYVSAGLFGPHPGIPIPVVFLVGLGIGLACGMANGLMVALGRVPSLVVTLATLYIIRGIDILIVGGNEVTAQTLPNAFTDIPRANVLGVPVPGHRGRGGDRHRRLLPAAPSGPAGSCTRSGPTRKRPGWPASRSAAGSSPRSRSAARSPGWPGCCGRRSTRPSTPPPGTGYELTVISAVVVGGVAIFGGSGSAVGAAVGALLLISHQLGAERAGHLAAVAGGHLRLPAAGGHHAGPGHLAAAAGRAATKEFRRWNLTCTRAAQHRRPGLAALGDRPGPAGHRHRHLRRGHLAAVPDQHELLQHRGHLGRDRDHGAAHDADHHQRRDRPVGGLDPGHVQRAARLPVGPALADAGHLRHGGAARHRGRPDQRPAGDPGRAAVAGRHDRHAGAVPRGGADPARPEHHLQLPGQLHEHRHQPAAGHPDPVQRGHLRGARGDLRRSCCTSPRPAGPSTRWAPARRRRCSPGSGSSGSRPCCT